VAASSHPVLDRVLDVDSHEMAPLQLWGQTFGPAAGEIAGRVAAWAEAEGNDLHAPGVSEDTTPIRPDTAWQMKGCLAPGAFDFSRRLDVLDTMGISRQLVFPSFGIVASMFKLGDEFRVRTFLGLTDTPVGYLRELGAAGLSEYNHWVAATTSANPDRFRCVGYLTEIGSVDALLAETEALLARGVRAVNIPHGVPPGGVSPADPALDGFWGMLEKNNVPLLTHVGNEEGLFATTTWKKAPAFYLKPRDGSIELGREPYTFACLHFAAEHFLTVLVLGGVLERFPELRIGMIEQGSSWLGPAADHLDMWARDVYFRRLKPFLSMLPSDYINRNVRVTPFNDFEPIARDFERYQNISDSYCYSTDYPHMEGGQASKQTQYDRLKPLGQTVVEKFFLTNAKLLMPD
jgi:predicted TIM-barrel fold metal-dependent hydrolase